MIWHWHEMTLPVPAAVADLPLSRFRGWADEQAAARLLRLGLVLMGDPEWRTEIQGDRHVAKTRVQVRPADINPTTPAEADAGAQHGWCQQQMHPMTPDNTLTGRSNGARCRACAQMSEQRRSQRRREHEAARRGRQTTTTGGPNGA